MADKFSTKTTVTAYSEMAVFFFMSINFEITECWETEKDKDIGKSMIKWFMMLEKIKDDEIWQSTTENLRTKCGYGF